MECREVWFTNMLVLGFEPASSEDQFKVAFHRDMFVHINKKGSEVVLHYLFSRLNSHLAYEEFRDCWPIYDKKQEQHFRKTCSIWLARISKEEPESKLPRLASSLLLSPGGDKYYIFLLRLSAYVLKHTVLREGKAEEKEVFISDFVKSSAISSTHRDVCAAAVKAHIVRNNQQVVNRMQLVADLHKEWEAYSSQLVSDYRSKSKSIKELTSKLHTIEEEHKQRTAPRTLEQSQFQSPTDDKVRSLSVKVMAKQRLARMEKARKLWKALEMFEDRSRSQREVIGSTLEDQTDRYTVDAKDIDFQIPKMLVHRYESLLQAGKADNTYQAGKLNLISLVQLWNCSLKELRDHLRANELPHFEEECVYMTEKLHTHRAHLSAANELSNSLSEHLNSLQQGVLHAEKTLKEVRGFLQVIEDDSIDEVSQIGQPPVLVIPPVVIPSLDVGLLPPSPEKSMLCLSESSPTTHPTRLSSLQDNGLSTPEAIQNISRSVHAASRTTHVLPHFLASGSRAPVSRLPVSSRIGPQKRVPAKKKAHVKKTNFPSRSLNFVDDSSTPDFSSSVVSKTVTKASSVSRIAETSSVNTSSNPPSGVAKDTFMVTTVSPSTHVTSVTKPDAQDILADQIADAVASQSEQQMLNNPSPVTPCVELHSITDTLSALGKDAFVSKDVIPRTPISKKTSGRRKDVNPGPSHKHQGSMDDSTLTQSPHSITSFQSDLSMERPTTNVRATDTVSLSTFECPPHAAEGPQQSPDDNRDSFGVGEMLCASETPTGLVTTQTSSGSSDDGRGDEQAQLATSFTEHIVQESEHNNMESGGSSDEITEPSPKVVWQRDISLDALATPLKTTGSSDSPRSQQQAQHSPLNPLLTTPSTSLQSQPLIDFTPDSMEHLTSSVIKQTPLGLAGSASSTVSNEQLKLLKLCTPTSSPLQYPDIFNTPTNSVELLSAIEPPTPFQFANFDLDSSFTDEDEPEEGEKYDSLLSGSSRSSFNSLELHSRHLSAESVQPEVATGELIDL